MPFTPLRATLGGVVLGLSAFWRARLQGKVVGISGKLRRALSDRDAFLFLLGLTASAQLPLQPSQPDILTSLPNYQPLLAGLLVGSGTVLANGCTSGHGLSGLSRLSLRSLVAVISFMGSGMITATLTQTKGRLGDTPIELPLQQALPRYATALLTALAGPPLLAALSKIRGLDSICRAALSITYGLTFGMGLAISGMSSPAKTTAFLDLGTEWDPSLLFVFAGALPIAYLGFAPLRRGAKPVLEKVDSLPRKTGIDWKLVLGSALFGMGWGGVGVCPGPAMVYLGGVGGWGLARFLGGVVGGGIAASWVASRW